MTTQRTIRLNADAGEDPAALESGREEALVRTVTAINAAAGGHAGDDATLRALARLCKQHAVAFGAHPAYPDPEHFGRRSMDLPADALRATLVEQITRVRTIALEAGTPFTHVKPHGALYHDAATHPAVARTLREALDATDPGAALVLPPTLTTRSAFGGIAILLEAFADRAYAQAGLLRPRTEPGALLEDPHAAAEQTLRLAREGLHGERIDTICVHADTPGALEISRAVRTALEDAGYVLRR